MNNNFFTRFTVLIKDRGARNRVAVFGSGDFVGKKGAHPHDDPDLGDGGGLQLHSVCLFGGDE